jgi:MOSC domain-containing protein YiiM
MSDSTLVSVNVGTPRSVEWRGRTIVTSIFKSPVRGRVRLEATNVAGDAQADREVHGGPDMAVYAYASEDYAWWQEQLQAALGPGHFGENLTTRGIDVNAAQVGERWRIGTALLEVASPRFPCSKLAMRMDDPAFVKRFAEARRPGAYFRVIEPGELGAGDGIAVEYRPERSITIAQFSDIYFGGPPRAAELLNVERLPQSWRSWASEKGTSR